MQHFFKNLDYATPLPLAAQVDCRPGQIASKTLVQNPAVGLTLFAFDAGEEISSHTSTGDALVQVLEGALEVTIAGTTQPVRAGLMLSATVVTRNVISVLCGFSVSTLPLVWKVCLTLA